MKTVGPFARLLGAMRAGRSGPWALASAFVLALLIAPLAVGQSSGVEGRAAAGEGDPLIGGERNPGGNQTNEL